MRKNERLIVDGEVLVLSSLRGVFWAKHEALFIADLHLGKTAHFRKYGMAIPHSVTHKDLQRIQLLIEEFSPRRLIIVGDLLHVNTNVDTQTFYHWRQQFPQTSFELVPGNHDRLTEEQYAELGVRLLDEKYLLGGFCITHGHLSEPKNCFHISGHLHPGVVIKGPARQRLRLPAFVLIERTLYLPAFSSFTGIHPIKGICEASYAIAGDEVLCL